MRGGNTVDEDKSGQKEASEKEGGLAWGTKKKTLKGVGWWW